MRKRNPLRIHVHTIDTGNNRRDSHNQCNDRQGFHDTVHSVVNDRGEKLSGTIDDITVNSRHLDCLLVLDDHITKQFLIFRILLQSLVSCQSIQHNSICTERCREVYECGFQLVKRDQIDFFGIIADTFLDLCTHLVNNTQITLVEDRDTIQNLVYKTKLLLRAEFLHTII